MPSRTGDRTNAGQRPACGVLALGHATRAAVDAPHTAYLSVLDTLAVAAALGAALQLALVDDDLSWLSAGGVALLLGTLSTVGLTVALPGEATRYPLLSVVMLGASAFVVDRVAASAQATGTPSKTAARTPRCASSARKGTGSSSTPRP